MKKLFFILMTVSLFNAAYALDFEKGANVPDIHPRILRNLLKTGIDNFEGKKIVISKDATVPGSFKNKWQERKLTGESVPVVGTAGADVIFIKSF